MGPAAAGDLHGDTSEGAGGQGQGVYTGQVEWVKIDMVAGG